MRKGWLLAGSAAIVFLLLAYAWVDGGREPLHTISQPVPVPEMTQ
jgi:hypothetical protein